MSEQSAISWTEATWNPTTGCDRVSPGCANCYALAMAKRLKAAGNPRYQKDGGRASGPGFGLTVHPDLLDLPLRWKKPRRVFVDSMTDLFHDDVPDSFLLDIWLTMAMAPEHTFQVLTKRPDRMRAWVSSLQNLPSGHKLFADDIGWPLPNVWLGVSVENQHWADERIPVLLDTPAAVRFISAEPLLSGLDLRKWIGYGRGEQAGRTSGMCRCDRRGTGDRSAGSGVAGEEARVGSLESSGAAEQVQTSSSRAQDAEGLPPDTGDDREAAAPRRGTQTRLPLLSGADSGWSDREPQERHQGRQPSGELRVGDSERTADSRLAHSRSGSASQSAGRAERDEQVDERTGESDPAAQGVGRTTCPNCGGFRSALPNDLQDLPQSTLDPSRFWVIAGGESGPGRAERKLVEGRYVSGGPQAPPGHKPQVWWPKPQALEWVRSLRDQAVAAGVPYFWKQWGGPRPTSGGRLLDGRTWDEMPA